MMTMAFDTLKAMKRLTATGVEEAQAEAIIETVGGAMTESLATKDDLALLKADLTAEIAVGIAEVRTEIAESDTRNAERHAKIAEGIAEVRGEIAGSESRLETKIAEVRGEIAGSESRLETKIAEVRGDIAGSESRLETKIAEVRGDIAAEIAEGRGETAAGIAESDARNAERYAKIAEGQTTQLRWMVGCMIAIAGVLVSTLVLGT